MRVLSPPSIKLSDLSFMETLVLLQHREQRDLHVLLPLHMLSLSSSSMVPLFLLKQLFFPSLTYIPYHSAALSVSSIMSQSPLCAFPAFSEGWYFSLSTSTVSPSCMYTHPCVHTHLHSLLSSSLHFFRCNLERHL